MDVRYDETGGERKHHEQRGNLDAGWLRHGGGYIRVPCFRFVDGGEWIRVCSSSVDGPRDLRDCYVPARASLTVFLNAQPVDEVVARINFFRGDAPWLLDSKHRHERWIRMRYRRCWGVRSQIWVRRCRLR